MKLKKILRTTTFLFLTTGASVILGFLSFGGMYALWPILPLAFAAFTLSVVYELEIYLQNIKGAWNKLFKKNYLQHQLSNEFLLDNFPDTEIEDCPEFFKDYEKQLSLLDIYNQQSLDKEGRATKKREEKKLRDMEKWFSLQLFSDLTFEPGNVYDISYAKYQGDILHWCAKNFSHEKKQQLNEFQGKFRLISYFSILAGLFMSVGTMYLLMEAFAVIPLFTTLPFIILSIIIVSLSIIAGVAYGFLTHNAVTDMIANNTINEWYKDLTRNFSFRTVVAWLLVSLAIGLTICTAGTWWTVVKETRPLFNWMAKLPSFIMGIINPIITGLAAVVFNLENTRESLQMILSVMTGTGHVINHAFHLLKNHLTTLCQHENILQLINPFRLFILLTITPLRILLFMGHLISIGVTADRLPGVSQQWSALLGFISEFFEDIHYFFGHHNHETHDHDHNHDHKAHLRQERLGKKQDHCHDLDIPTRVLTGIYFFLGVYYLAACWDWVFSQLNTSSRASRELHRLTWKEAQENAGLRCEKTFTLSNDVVKPSTHWTLVHMVYRIQRYKEKELTPDMDHENQELTTIQNSLCNSDDGNLNVIKSSLRAYGKEKVGFFNASKINNFLSEELPYRVDLIASL